MLVQHERYMRFIGLRTPPFDAGIRLNIRFDIVGSRHEQRNKAVFCGASGRRLLWRIKLGRGKVERDTEESERFGQGTTSNG